MAPSVVPTSSPDSPLGPSASPRASRLRKLLMWIALVIAVLACAGGIWWMKGGRFLFTPRNWGVVEPGAIYRSGQVSSRLIEPTLKKNHIAVVLFMSGDKMERTDVHAEVDTCNRLGVARYNFPLGGDGTGDIVQYANALAELAKARTAGQAVLVHCHTGAQRTGGMIAFYRMLVQGWSGADAAAELLRYGHDPDQNNKLIPYMNAHMSELARLLVDRKVIDKVPDPLPVITANAN